MSTDTHSQQRLRRTQKVTVVGAIVNALLGLLKIIIGTVGQSSALVADGIHSLSDLFCDALVWGAAKFAHVDADDNHPYGHRRFETLATFALGVILLVIGLSIALVALMHIVHGHEEYPDAYTIVAAVISIAANEWLFRYTLKTGNEIDSDLLRANAWHSRGDMLSSAIVLVGLIGSLLGWPVLDSVAAIVVGLFILKIGVEWGWRAVSELSDEGLDAVTLAQVKKVIVETEGVRRMHQLRTRKMAERVMVDVHVQIDAYISAAEGHYISDCVRFNLMSNMPSIKDVTVHVDVDDDDHPYSVPTAMPPTRSAILAACLPVWEKIVAKDQIRDVVIYYFEGRIELVVVVSLDTLTPRGQTAETLFQALADALSDNGEMSLLSVCFSAE